MNLSLLLISVFLLLNLFEVTLPSFGQAQYVLDKEEPLCIVNWGEQFNSWNELNQCCLEARKQLGCTKYSGRAGLDWECKTGEGKVLKYLLNHKAYNYCHQLEFWK